MIEGDNGARKSRGEETRKEERKEGRKVERREDGGTEE